MAMTKETALAKVAERARMCCWDTEYIPAVNPEAKPAPRRQTSRQARASSLVARAKQNALRLIQEQTN